MKLSHPLCGVSVISMIAVPIASCVPGGTLSGVRSMSMKRLSPAGAQLSRSCAISAMQRAFMMQIWTSG